MDLIVWLEDVRKDDVRSVGDKAASIGELMAAGFVVPPGFVLTADAYRSGRGTGAADLVEDIARMAMAVELHTGATQDVEWCYDASGVLFVLQARPIHVPRRPPARTGGTGAVVAIGVGASPGVAAGRARVLAAPEEADELDPGDVVDRVAGVVADRGGVTSHLAVACREQGVPCVVGATTASFTVRAGDFVAVDGTVGMVRSVRSSATLSGDRR